jgi:hypothetical protein
MNGAAAVLDGSLSRLVAVARTIDPQTYLLVLLGGEAGLRCGACRAPASAQRTRPVPGRLRRFTRADRAGMDEAGGAAGERQARGSHPAPLVLLHLSMRGAPAKAIQELAGHADLP